MKLENAVSVRDFRKNLKQFTRSEAYTVVEDRNGPIALVIPLQRPADSWRCNPKIKLTPLRNCVLAFVRDYKAKHD